MKERAAAARGKDGAKAGAEKKPAPARKTAKKAEAAEGGEKKAPARRAAKSAAEPPTEA